MDLIKKIKNYTINERHCLGQGSFGKVYEATSDEGRKVAIKRVDQRLIMGDRYLRESLDNQILIMKKLKHPNIVQLYEVITTANNIYLVMEFCSGGDLKRYCTMKKINEEKAFDILKQIARGFQQMGKLGVIHRDLKPANILVHQQTFKICDFGFAKFFGDSGKMAKTCVGTPIYMSPQVLKQKQYTAKTDIWSMGVIFYELLFGRLPYNGSNEDNLFKNITKGQLDIPSCSKQAQRILRETLVIQQKERWGWPQFLQFLFGTNPIDQQKRQRVNTSPIFYQQYLKPQISAEKDKKRQLNLVEKRIPISNNYFIDENQQVPLDQGREVRRMPVNMFAAQNQVQKYSPISQHQIRPINPPNIAVAAQQRQTEQNPRFMYFVLVELIVNPIDALSYESFIYNFWKYTAQQYGILLQKAQGFPPLYQRVLQNQLMEILALQPSIKVMKEGNVRNIGQILLNEGKTKLQNKKKIVWLHRFLNKQYSYEVID